MRPHQRNRIEGHSTQQLTTIQKRQGRECQEYRTDRRGAGGLWPQIGSRPGDWRWREKGRNPNQMGSLVNQRTNVTVLAWLSASLQILVLV